MMLQMYAMLNNYYNIQIVKFLITWMYFQLKKDTGTGKPKFVEVCMECHIGDTVGWHHMFEWMTHWTVSQNIIDLFT